MTNTDDVFSSYAKYLKTGRIKLPEDISMEEFEAEIQDPEKLNNWLLVFRGLFFSCEHIRIEERLDLYCTSIRNKRNKNL